MAATPPPAVRADFADRLRLTRINRGFKTARALAKAIGIDENRYTRYERAEVEPDLTLLAKICTTLGVSANELLDFSSSAVGVWPANSGQEVRAVQGGFQEAGSSEPGFESSPDARQNLLRRDAVAWQLAARIAAVKGFAGADKNEPDDAPAVMQRTACLFGKLLDAPFAFISRIFADEAVLGLPAGEIAAIKRQIDQLISSINCATPSS